MSGVRRLALLSAVVALSACYRWSAPLSPTAPGILQTRGGDLLVTPQTGPVVHLVNARITGDTLRGSALVSHLIGDVTYRDFAVPLAEVQSVSRREFSLGRTALLVGSGTLVVVGAVAIMNDVQQRYGNIYAF
jgi:hypothetical protein